MRSKWLIALTAVALTAGVAQATATLTIDPWITGYETATELVPITPTKAVVVGDYPGALDFEVALVFTLANPDPNTCFGNVGFDILLAGVTDAYGYIADTSTYTYKVGTKTYTQAYWKDNADLGPSPSDLLGILVSVASDAGEKGGAADPRPLFGLVGQGYEPMTVGWVYVAPGVANGSVTLAPVAGTPWSLLDMTTPSPGGTYIGQSASTMFVSPPVEFIIPEPATMALLALGGLLALRRRR